MATRKETVEHILRVLGSPERFRVRAMFGEYALYADNKVVALVCDDLLYVKITPESLPLASLCEQDYPYDGARLHYMVEEDQIERIKDFPEILFAISKALPVPKKKERKQKT